MLLLGFSTVLLTICTRGALSAKTCPANNPINIKAPMKNIWAPLSQSLTKQVEAWLYAQEALNLTAFAKGKLK